MGDQSDAGDDRESPSPEPGPGEQDAGTEAAEQAFLRGLAERGEIAPAGEEELPPGATHEVVEEDGEKRVRRRRFSAF